MAKVKFNYYSSIQNFTKANPKPDKGTISFVKDTESGKNTIYLGENEFSCNESAVKTIIKAFLKTGEADLNLKDLAAQVGTNKKAIETNTGNITTLTGKVNELDQKALMSIVEVVTQLPTIDKAKANTIYLVPDADNKNETYIEYLLIEVGPEGSKEKKFEILGKHQMTVDLTPYAKTSQLKDYAKKTDLDSLATKDELGGVKATAEGASATAKAAKAQADANKGVISAIQIQLPLLATKGEVSKKADQTTVDTLDKKVNEEIKAREAADKAIDGKIQASVAGAMTWGGDGITE